MWNRHNVHKMFINIYRNPKTRNWFRYETFIHLFEFKSFSTWGERDTIFLCWKLLHRQLSTQPTRGACSAQSRLASPSSESQPSRSEAGTQLTAFTQISAHALGVWRHPNTLVLFPIWDFYFDISEWHILSARAWTPALMLHLTHPCAKRKVLSLTKPKGKVYKTKSLGNYITDDYRTPWEIITEEHYKKIIIEKHYVRSLKKSFRGVHFWQQDFFIWQALNLMTENDSSILGEWHSGPDVRWESVIFTNYNSNLQYS